MDEEKLDQPEPVPVETEFDFDRRKVMRKVDPEEKLPFVAHLEELRWRLIYCVVTVAVTFAALYVMSDYLYQVIRKPIGRELVFLAPAEAFFVYLKISIYAALIVSVPMILYQAWEFIAPGLLPVERRSAGPFVIFGTIFFAIGAAFCYFMVLPYGLEFLIGYGGEGLTPMISVGAYVSFVFKLMIAFGVIFELPIVILFLTRLGIMDPESIAAKRPYLVVGSFIIASLLTPPDIFTQIIMALPIIALFEMSLLAARFFVKEEADDGE